MEELLPLPRRFSFLTIPFPSCYTLPIIICEVFCMIPSIITRHTAKEDWPGIRTSIRTAIAESLGMSPAQLTPAKNTFEEIDRYTAYGLTHIKLRYHVLDDEWATGILVLPNEPAEKPRAVLTIHGTNGATGKYGMLDLAGRPNRAYAIELAQQGFATFSPDQYGFGEDMLDPALRAQFDSFYTRYPAWSLTGRRLLGHIRALDVLDQLNIIRHDGYGVMGNSLGGHAAFYVAAFDERIRSAVLSTGISPHITNVYRNLRKDPPFEPAVDRATALTGHPPWEYNELLALCAPRAVLCIEPINDPYNPYTATIACVQNAWEVYRLLDAPKNLSMHIHGDGHDTVPAVRRFAYTWLAEHL